MDDSYLKQAKNKLKIIKLILEYENEKENFINQRKKYLNLKQKMKEKKSVKEFMKKEDKKMN
ncbi:hypothetical protein CWI39_1560p0020 [Hamiltosporidium magnivora]|uniref:Uncharacterized protein n=1 Tax=Hamiltosporidium magnivora TaxID=148818 RepID=A0A4Q9L0J5_9MICR|nr:hypothetical protein CWI39_1560p0020 [Hamiltosporidium magnivora]TBU01754.1 hypothetical protein CWI36_1269p0020 [Hamiltosporidium magnivora]